MTPLVTDRLVLRQFEPGDLDDLFAMDSDDRVMKYLGSGLAGRTREQCEQSLERLVERAATRPGYGLLHASLREGGAFVGGCGLFRLPEGEDIELAYRLPHARWGQGFATEMARAVLAHGFENLGLARVVGVTWPQNLPSQRVLQKIGMRREADAEHYGVAMHVYAAARA
jgi:RimJ/RimL family protein N-acetyltransferase